jgi:CRP-like cAMP-binding protein
MVEHNPASRSLAFTAGGRLLRQAFRKVPYLTAERDAVIVSAEDPRPPVILIDRGIAYSSHTFPNGRRAIVDIVLPTDIVGLESAFCQRPSRSIIAASAIGYRLIPAQSFRPLMAAPQVAARVAWLIADTKWRTEQQVLALSRLNARSRVAAFLLGIYDRLRCTDLADRPTFNLHLSQDQIGDHLGITMVHVSRTLRLMREERLVIVDHGVFTILDVERLRAAANGLPALLRTKEIDTPSTSRSSSAAGATMSGC